MDIWIAGSIDEVLDAAQTGLVGAIVTNPTVIASWTKDGGNLEDSVVKVTSRTDIPVYVQLYGPDSDKFLKETEYLRKIAPNVYPKLPATLEGITAAKSLSKQGIDTLITTVCTPEQAYASAVAGAAAICPYVARMNDYDKSTEELLQSISEMYRRHSVETKIIPASVRTVDDVRLCLRAGCHGVIVFYDIFKKLFEHPVMKESLDGFEKDWNSFRYKFR